MLAAFGVLHERAGEQVGNRYSAAVVKRAKLGRERQGEKGKEGTGRDNGGVEGRKGRKT